MRPSKSSAATPKPQLLETHHSLPRAKRPEMPHWDVTKPSSIAHGPSHIPSAKLRANHGQLGHSSAVTLLLATAGVCLFVVALYGLGRMGERGLHVPPQAWPITSALGLALLVAAGGLLNLMGWAFSVPLLGLGTLGLASAAWHFKSAWRKAARPRPFSIIVAFVSGLIMLFALATLVPAAVFNAGDDLQKYFVHPAHMVQVGRVSTSTLSAMGLETLGGQAFLHGFVLAVAGFDCLNAIELGLALPLCVALAGIGETRSSWQLGARVVGMAAIVLVNPQIVNISSSFTSVVLLLGMLLLVQAAPESERGHARACGVMLAALCAVKTSLVLVAAGLAAALVAAFALHTHDWRRVWAWSRNAATAATVCLLPWVLLHVRNWVSALTTPTTALPPPTHPYDVSLFSGRDCGFGIGCAPFTVAVGAVALLGILAWITAPRAEGRRPWSACLAFSAGVTLAIVYSLSMHVVGPLGQGAQTTLRLFIPVLLGCLPAVAVLATQHLSASSPVWTRILASAALGLVVLPLPRLAFALDLRVEGSLKHGCVLHFGPACSPGYIAYTRYVLHGKQRRRIADMQAVVPAGAPLVAWLYTPFYLDFRRNPITEGDYAGLATPWAAVPPATYVLWEYRNLMSPPREELEALRREPARLEAKTADAVLRLAHALETLRAEGTVLADDGRFMVLKLADQHRLQRLFTTPYADEMHAATRE